MFSRQLDVWATSCTPYETCFSRAVSINRLVMRGLQTNISQIKETNDANKLVNGNCDCVCGIWV